MRVLFTLLLLAASIVHPGDTRAQTPVVPDFWDPQERFIKPNLADRRRLRFLTVTDFPPFSYVDGRKRLSGFHVDLARMVCEELSLLAVCQIQGMPPGELDEALARNAGDAIMAGLAPTARSRSAQLHSRTYFRLPARLAVRRDGPLVRLRGRDTMAALEGRTLGVVDATSHAAFARAHMRASVRVRLFASQDAAFGALRDGAVDAVFSDALTLARRLQSETGAACCTLAGEPFLAPPYFGRPMTVAVRGDEVELIEGINYALRAIAADGRFTELYLRYFPVSLF